MDNIERSLVYLRGLIDGLDYDETTPEGRVFNGIIDVLETIGDEFEMLSSQGRYCEDMLEEILDEQCEDFDEEFDDDFVQVECPNCKDTIFFDNETYEKNDNLICPNCNEAL